ncbi:MAG: hypothetical protein MUF49_04390 [Oculatellaceae cyanobacterium Prado106]|jgi:hypothetical protein|nr:hypothetical protein [Oculatellaceae cyanobacterium Prado106]
MIQIPSLIKIQEWIVLWSRLLFSVFLLWLLWGSVGAIAASASEISLPTQIAYSSNSRSSILVNDSTLNQTDFQNQTRERQTEYNHEPQKTIGVLIQRLQQFPDWTSLPPTRRARGDLFYPDWFAGLWEVQTTLIDLVAPLAPEVVSPGFESAREGLQQAIAFQVRFVPEQELRVSRLGFRSSPQFVSDRAFNGANLAKATLAKAALTSLGKPAKNPILAVKVDPTNPNRQITLLREGRQLVSTVTGRAVEAPNADQFVTTELFEQEFRGAPQVYFNRVENTTAYTRQSGDDPAITADQVTAVYLSPQDSDYFKVGGDRPVALYRYRLEFRRSHPE